MEKIRLKNGNAYDIEGCASENAVSMTFTTLAESIPVIEDFTKENLSKVEFLTEAGEVCGTYIEKVLSNAEVVRIEGGHRVIFHLTDVVPESDEILNILLGGAE